MAENCFIDYFNNSRNIHKENKTVHNVDSTMGETAFNEFSKLALS